MITTENIKLKLPLPVDDRQIEAALTQKGIVPLRWAVIAADGNDFLLNVSFEK